MKTVCFQHIPVSAVRAVDFRAVVLTVVAFAMLSLSALAAQQAGDAVNTVSAESTVQGAAPAADGSSTLTPVANAEPMLGESDALASADDDSRQRRKPLLTVIPDAKRPRKPDAETVRELDNADTENSREKNTDTLRFGLEGEIAELLEKLARDDDVRFVDDVYDLFQDTKSPIVREKALAYFAKLDDPCLEDYAVEILDEPYDEKLSTVNACFAYVRAVKTKAAIPPVTALIESENQDYFASALDTLGEIGGKDEALYLADLLDRDDLTVPQRQSLVRVLGKLKATETYERLAELANDSDENSFVRMYAAEAIGSMEQGDAIGILVELYEDSDPNIRAYVVKGLSHFTDSEAQNVLIQATRDAHYKVRLEAIAAIKEQKLAAAVPYLIYRAKNDPERVVKEASYPVIALLNTKEGNDYLITQLTDKKVSDTVKSRVAAALLAENKAGTQEVIALAAETLTDNRRTQLRYALGKEFAKYARNEFASICGDYIASKDTSTSGTGLDIYAKGRYASVTPAVQALADMYDPAAKTRNGIAQKACRILGISDEAAEKKAAARKAE